ncbi:MAG: flavodoxin-dependent (E)-4-hydroxy-3-methylbut-2-enyl-diphosphate synthase [Desulfovibrionaceae bacterium]
MQHPILPYTRHLSKQIMIGGIPIGNGAPVVVQSMTTTKTHNVEDTLAQIEALHHAGCQIVRLAVPDIKSAEAIKEIKQHSTIPLVADIHFDYKLALKSIENGIDALRINPGNIGKDEHVVTVVKACQEKNIPIRIGVNSGSIEKHILEKYKGPTPEAMVESALYHVLLLEELNFTMIKISLKSSNVIQTIQAYQLLAQRCNYPLHLGITEAGSIKQGTIKSSVGIGTLLALGLGDTLRVSLTADPVDEIPVAIGILHSLNLYKNKVEIISCPSCGRTDIDLFPLVEKVENYFKDIHLPITVAVMGCVVNGPGEAKHADIGIAGGKDKGIIFKKGVVIRSVRGNDNLFPAFKEELDILLASLSQ